MTAFLDFHEIVDDLLLYQLTDADKITIRRMVPDADLIDLHSSIGSEIRQLYSLWDTNNPHTMLDYSPIYQDDVDVNPRHPENMSYRIIQAVWKRLQ